MTAHSAVGLLDARRPGHLAGADEVLPGAHLPCFQGELKAALGLLEAGLGTYLSNWNGRERPDNNRDLINVTEQCAGVGGCPALLFCPAVSLV